MKRNSDTTQEFMDAYEEFADAIFRHCYFRTSNEELAKDLLQETFIRTWKYIADGKEVQHMRSFLYRVCNNLIVDEFRRKKFSHSSLEALEEKGFTPIGEEKGKLQRIVEAKDAVVFLDNLTVEERDLITMRYIDELSPKEIAEILEESENTVSVRIHRALKKARQLWQEHEENI